MQQSGPVLKPNPVRFATEAKQDGTASAPRNTQIRSIKATTHNFARAARLGWGRPPLSSTMEIEGSRKRKRTPAAAAAAEDRLSELPDCLLHDILALVGSRQAVRTSVLSRRWRGLWRSAPRVDIDQREFRRACGGEEGEPVVDCDGFEDFADGILSPTLLGGTGTPPLDAFRLHLLYEGRFITFGRWVRRALTRRPASVDIHVEYGGTVDWPPALTLGDGAGTGRLKRLHLFGVHLGFISGDGGRLAELLPVLEDLRMESCTFGHEPSSPTTTIAIPTLRSLALAVVPRRTARPYALTVASPRVASLRLFLPFSRTRAAAVRVAPAEEGEALASLVTASITVLETDQELNRRMNKHKLDFLASTRNMLDRFPNVRNLDLSGFPTIVRNCVSPIALSLFESFNSSEHTSFAFIFFNF